MATVLDPTPDPTPPSASAREAHHRGAGRRDRAASDTAPAWAAARVVAVGYVVVTLALLAVGLLLTHPLKGSVGAWDEHVNQWIAGRRREPFDTLTLWATRLCDTVPVIAIATIVAALMLLRHRWREALFLALALVVDITAFLSTTFVIGRPRPGVVRMNSTPETSSYPSGHTAAATVLFVGIAIIVTCCTAKRVARAASITLAAVLAVLVGFARVYRGLHHPTDVIVGLLFGAACLLVAARAVRAVSTMVAARPHRSSQPERRTRVAARRNVEPLAG